MQGNWTAQVEEVVALQAILEEDFSLLGGQGLHDGIDLTADSLIELEPPSAPIRLECQALARVSLLRDSLDLRVGSARSTAQRGDEQGSSADAGSGQLVCQLQHLPPICLHLVFPEGYPSNCSPEVSISAIWLAPPQVKTLEKQLQQLWQENGPGVPICYIWIDWLQNSALEHLGITDSLTINNEKTCTSGWSSHEGSTSAVPSWSADGSYRAAQDQAPPGGSQTQDSKPGRAAKEATCSQAQQTTGSAWQPAGGNCLQQCSNGLQWQKQQQKQPSSKGSSFQRDADHAKQQHGMAPPGTDGKPCRLLSPTAATFVPQQAGGPSISMNGTAPTASDQLPSAARAEANGHASTSAAHTPPQPRGKAQSAIDCPQQQGSPHRSLQAQHQQPLQSSQQPLQQQVQVPPQRRAGQQTGHPSPPRHEQEGMAQGSQQQWQQQEPQQAQQQPAELVIMQLLRYNAARDHQLFREGTWACGICLEELPGVRCLRVGDCKHAFCQDCLGQQCRLNVREGTIENLRCPEPQCKAPMNRQVVKSLLSPEEAARWEDLELQRTLAHMQDVVYCPRCSSACLEDGQNCAQCARCFFAYCSLCNEAWHPGRQCVSAATKLELLRNRMKGVRHESGSELRRKELEMMSLKSIEETTKPCPRCSMAIQKSQGCNKMTCANCNTFFCYRCGREIEGYSHYKDSGCVLFEEAEILRWQDEWEAQQHGAVGHVNQLAWAQHARANDAPPGMRVCPCPQCGQANMKVGNNNHMACWACTCHFCYSCRKLLRGKGIGAAHYGPKGCKQHSAD